ncbi:MAG: PAS domain S-box protein [Ignavibacteriaceae bacterium]|nr:PAS domain S-box protein [Ignavibacterium sp.]MCC6254423.1 PAS domain S-box protein [Ignavibacteriaceae bacterium]HRN27298.1 PAS domain S-box protein [Ignavibacteriaceae bacterium]HRQ54715.1 PAS domain S-box protein [Ignavibacteriaceae bacterium]
MLKDNLDKYCSLYDNLPLIHITINYDFKIISINKNGAKELGYEVEELIGLHLAKLFIPQESDRIEKQVQYVLLNPNKQSSHEMKMLHKNGREYWVRETIYTTDDSNLSKKIFFVFDNITYQKNAEANAKYLAQSLQNMLDASPLGVLVYSLDENDQLILISTNQSAVNILQIDVYALISKNIRDIFPSLVKDNVIGKFIDVVKTGQPLLNQNLFYEDIHFKGVYEFSVMKLSNKTIAVFFTDVTEKTKALDSLKQSELKFKTLFDSANDAIFLMKEDVFIDCNEKTTVMFNASKEQIIGKKLYLFSPEFQPDGRTSKSKAKEKLILALEGTPQFFEWRHTRLDGTQFDTEVNINHIEFQNEVYLQAIVRDITERKKSEKIISEQKRELATLMNNLPGMAYRCANNLNWTMEFVSDGCYQLTGYRKDELLNDKIISYTNLMHKEDQLLVYETVQNAINNHEQFTLLYRINTRQGLEKWVWEKGCAIYDENGNVICLEGFVTDITERKLAEEKINILAHALKSVSECVWITNMRDNIIFVNKSFTRVYGYSLTEIIGKPISFIRSPKNDPAVLKKIYPETLAGGWTGELIDRRKNGEDFPIHLSTSLITDDTGKPIALAGVSLDITESQKNEFDLIEAKEKAEQASRLKSNFFTNISHELRTPLVGILGFAEILKDEIKQPQFSDMAEMILSSGKRLMETLNSVLDLSRIEADKLEMKYTPVDLNIFVDENAKIFQSIGAKKGLSVITKKSKQSVYAYVDEQVLFQILNNLIGNAIKYTHKGTVTLEVKVVTNNKKEFASIAVIDTGIGIKSENLNKIFEEFRQVSEGLSRHFEGTGLGLTITKRFIELMSGEIIVKSKFGKGSTFEVLFPLYKFKIIKDPEITDKISESKQEEKFLLSDLPDVLIVDNDEASRDIIRLFLKNICNVDSAKSGEEAIKLAKAKSYKLIFMDINLGKGLSGIETTQKIKKLAAYKNTPIVALTAFAMSGEKEEFLRKGCTHYLSKPFMKKDLLNLLKTILF